MDSDPLLQPHAPWPRRFLVALALALVVGPPLTAFVLVRDGETKLDAQRAALCERRDLLRAAGPARPHSTDAVVDEAIDKLWTRRDKWANVRQLHGPPTEFLLLSLRRALLTSSPESAPGEFLAGQSIEDLEFMADLTRGMLARARSAEDAEQRARWLDAQRALTDLLARSQRPGAVLAALRLHDIVITEWDADTDGEAALLDCSGEYERALRRALAEEAVAIAEGVEFDAPYDGVTYETVLQGWSRVVEGTGLWPPRTGGTHPTLPRHQQNAWLGRNRIFVTVQRAAFLAVPSRLDAALLAGPDRHDRTGHVAAEMRGSLDPQTRIPWSWQRMIAWRDEHFSRVDDWRCRRLVACGQAPPHDHPPQAAPQFVIMRSPLRDGHWLDRVPPPP